MSEWWLAALVAVGGGVGAMLRYLLDRAVQRRVRARAADRGVAPAPWGLLLVNVSGAAVAGVVGAISVAAGSPWWATVALAGVLGGYTTFSAASSELGVAMRARRWVHALLVGPAQLVVACGVAATLWWVTAQLCELV